MNDQPNQNPTTESAFPLFAHVAVVLIVVGGTVVDRVLHGLTEHAKKILRLLDIPEEVFTKPRKAKSGFA